MTLKFRRHFTPSGPKIPAPTARGHRDRGASAVEYGLLLAGIATIITAAVFGFGIVVRDTISHSTGCLAAQAASTC